MGGTGLGLAIVKHLVKAHGWSMKIESIQGKRTKIKIYILRKRKDNAFYGRAFFKSKKQFPVSPSL